MTYTESIDARIRGASWRYWNARLRDTTTIQFEDVLQFARLRILELGITDLAHIGNKTRWVIYREFIEAGRYVDHLGIPYIETPEEGEVGMALQQRRSIDELTIQRLASVSPEQMERLYENLWVLGSEKMYATMRGYIEGAARRTRHGPGIDTATVAYGTKLLRKSYGHQDDLLGTGPAMWVAVSARKNLRLFACSVGSSKWPMDATFRSRFKDLVVRNKNTNTTVLTDKGYAYVNNLTAEQRAFLARQL